MELVFQYRPGDSFLHRLDPITKVVGLFAISFLAFGTFFSPPQIGIAIVAFIIAMVAAKLGMREILRGTGFMIVASFFFFVVQSILLDVPGEIAVIRLGPKVINLRTLDYAFAVSLRIYTIFLVSFTFIRTTHPRDLAISFIQALDVPYRVPYAFFIALRVIPLIEEEAKTIRAAHKVRGVGEKTGIKGRIENLKRFTVPLMVRGLRGTSTTVQSMESRGFGAYPTRTFVKRIERTRTGKIITFVLIGAVIVWYTLIFIGVIPMNYSLQ